MQSSKHPKPPLIQAIGDLSGQRGGVRVVIANRLNSPLFKARVKVLQHSIVGNRTLLPRSCSFYANLQARPQQDKIERHFLQDLSARRNDDDALQNSRYSIEVARRDGVNATAAALHLDGGKLKRRMVAADSVSGKSMPPTFVELMAPAVDQRECTIELEGHKGKLRIHWKGATAADVGTLSRALWEVAS